MKEMPVGCLNTDVDRAEYVDAPPGEVGEVGEWGEMGEMGEWGEWGKLGELGLILELGKLDLLGDFSAWDEGALGCRPISLLEVFI